MMRLLSCNSTMAINGYARLCSLVELDLEYHQRRNQDTSATEGAVRDNAHLSCRQPWGGNSGRRSSSPQLAG